MSVYLLSSPVLAASTAGQARIVFDENLTANITLSGSAQWTSEKSFSGKKSLLCLPAKKLSSFFLKFTTPLVVDGLDRIICWVYLDPLNPPKGIMLKFESQNGWISGIYWEGRREVFNISEQQPIYYKDEIPSPGKWQMLEFMADEAEIDGLKVKSIEFITYGGRVYWDKMFLEKAAGPFNIDLEQELAPKSGQ